MYNTMYDPSLQYYLDYKARNFNKKRLLHRFFPVNIAKCLRTPIFKSISVWLLPSF